MLVSSFVEILKSIVRIFELQVIWIKYLYLKILFLGSFWKKSRWLSDIRVLFVYFLWLTMRNNSNWAKDCIYKQHTNSFLYQFNQMWSRVLTSENLYLIKFNKILVQGIKYNIDIIKIKPIFLIKKNIYLWYRSSKKQGKILQCKIECLRWCIYWQCKIVILI